MSSYLPNQSIAEPQILSIIPKQSERIIPKESQTSKKSKTIKDYYKT